MRRPGLIALAVLLVVIGIVATNSIFIVDPAEQALVLQFGKPVKLAEKPGLYFKTPFIQNVMFYDKRLLDLEPAPEEVIGADQKRLVVDTYTRYRITSPLMFYQSVPSEASMRGRLNALVSGSLRRVIGNVTLADLLSAQRPAIMRQIRDEVRAEAKSFGIDVVDVRIRRADLPTENSEAIYKRMVSQRQQQAAEYRAEGAEAAQEIRAKADRERTVILAQAQRDAQKIRGLGDAKATEIYAKAFGQDQSFFAFYRTMQAYRDALSGHNTAFVLNPQGDFFKYFAGAGATADKIPTPTASLPLSGATAEAKGGAR